LSQDYGVKRPARQVLVYNRQSQIELSAKFTDLLESLGEVTLGILEERYLARVRMPGSVQVSLVDDGEISRVHAQFMDNPDPTDVITFPYGDDGEILISVETAERQAREYKSSFDREITLYLVHGLLHLAGYDDSSEVERGEMEELQEALVSELLEGE
jgi:probable rRNA maturation factor